MNETRGIPFWLRLLGELVIIVLGVLIALTADSWIQLREDQRDEVGHLLALAGEFQESLGTLREAMTFKEKQIRDLGRLLSSDVVDLPPDSLDEWIYDGVYVTRGYVPVLSALRDLEASGELDLITDPAVRRGVALLGVRLEAVSRSFDEYVFYHQTVVDPFIATELPVVGLLASRNGVQLEEPVEPDWSLLDSARARGLLAFKLSLAGNYLGSLSDLEAQFAALGHLIDARLDTVGAPD